MLKKGDFKICSACRQLLTLDRFHRNKTMADGLNSECKECVRKRYLRNYRLDNPNMKERLPKLNPNLRDRYKKCPTCTLIKDIDEFYLSSTRHDGHSWQCNECENKRKSEYLVRKRKLSMGEQLKSRREFRNINSLESRQNEALEVLTQGVTLKNMKVKLPDDLPRNDLMDTNKVLPNLNKSN